jgi:predicted outer membrane repeat protein
MPHQSTCLHYPYTLTGAAATDTAFPIISSNVTIRGAGSGATIIQRAPTAVAMRIFRNAGTLTLQGMTIANARADNANGIRGGGVYNTGILTVEDVIFRNNFAYSEGAAIYGSTATNQITVREAAS